LRQRQAGFTLIEVLVTTVIVAIAIVGVLGGIQSLTMADSKAQDAVLLQRLANEKLNDLRILQDPSTAGSSGDFSDRGYPDVTWSAEVDSTSTTNLDQVTITATRGKNDQSLTTMLYVAPQTTTATATGTAAP
jgi:type II secretion system protein I